MFFPNWKSSRIEYDGKAWLNPVFPTDAVIEDCDNITGIGIIIGVDPTTVAGSSVLARFRWTHSTIKAREREHDDFKLPSGGTYQDWIRLDGDEKVNGTWSVSVTYHGTEIFTTSFELRNCNHGRPPWADPASGTPLSSVMGPQARAFANPADQLLDACSAAWSWPPPASMIFTSSCRSSRRPTRRLPARAPADSLVEG